MAYFLTGATGFIGRNLVECLLRRDGDIYILVRSSSLERLDEWRERWGAAATERIKPIVGDLSESRLGVDKATVDALRQARIEHFFHLAAGSDVTADADANQLANVDGTRHAIELARELAAGCLHHTSSIAVAGRYRGLF